MKYTRTLFGLIALMLAVNMTSDSTSIANSDAIANSGVQFTSTQFQEAYHKLLNGTLNVGGGSGSMIKWDNEKKIGYILTAYHVVAGNWAVHTTIPVSWHFQWEEFGTIHSVEGIILAVDEDNDLALVIINEKHEIFEIVSDSEYAQLERGRPLFSAGYPVGSINGLLIGPGYVYDIAFDDDNNPLTLSVLYHGCTGYYGFSGGPVIDVLTKKQIGVEVRFGPNFHSSSSLAAPAPTINAFLRRVIGL